MKEEWRPIEGYEGMYEVSSFGRVRSLNRHINCKNGSVLFANGKILTLETNRNGYVRVHVSFKQKARHLLVHRIVARAFIKNTKNRPQVNHIDGNKTNNFVNNLEWVTRKENIDHAIKEGLFTPRGEGSALSKLTNDMVIEIKNIINETSRSFDDISKEFSVYPSTIARIANGITWVDIGPNVIRSKYKTKADRLKDVVLIKKFIDSTNKNNTEIAKIVGVDRKFVGKIRRGVIYNEV